MKKVLVLPLFAMVAFVSQAWGEKCKYEGKIMGCGYPTGCYSTSTEYTNVPDDGSTCVGSETGKSGPTCTCDKIIEGCKKDGEIYTFNSEPSIWLSEPWGKGATCGSNGGTLAFTTSCGKWCKYSGKSDCDAIKPDPDGEYGSPTATCAEAIANCEGGGAIYDNANCSGGSPIFKFTPASTALIVAQSSRSLHISSAKDATVSLYDMSGAKVYSGKVRAGNSVFSLEKVAVGSYYAVVQSGSDAKKVPVVLK